MGVPVVTQIGETVVGRAGYCQLMNLGLPELVAQTEDQFVEIASDLAGNLSRLSMLRSSLRERMKSSPLMDALGFAASIESAYINTWHRWRLKG
jgi:predicted O-linked N-acetylglucosamine transferase (SPINDLY family)